MASLVVLDDAGRPLFNDLLFGRRRPTYVAFDLLEAHGVDARKLALDIFSCAFTILAKAATVTETYSFTASDFFQAGLLRSTPDRHVYNNLRPDQPFSTLTLDVMKNSRSRTLYERLGFRVIGPSRRALSFSSRNDSNSQSAWSNGSARSTGWPCNRHRTIVATKITTDLSRWPRGVRRGGAGPDQTN